MAQLEGYVEDGKEHLVCKLDKRLYRLQQSSRSWFKTMDRFLKDSEYEQCFSGLCLYVERVGEELSIISCVC